MGTVNILIVNNTLIPAPQYGGTERVIWGLGKALVKMGHRVRFLVQPGSTCPFAEVLPLRNDIPIRDQVPLDTDIVHLHFSPKESLEVPHVVTVHGNPAFGETLHHNSIFVSENHANRYQSRSYVRNGLDWDTYPKPILKEQRSHFHFLGKAAWRIKNVRGAIALADQCHAPIHVLGGHRLNFSMGFRFTLSPRARFLGMVDDAAKAKTLSHSRGLVFPVLWHEPFGLALIESLYYGSPVFGTPYGALPEIVGAEFGFLSNQASTLAAAMRQSADFDAQKCHEYARDTFHAAQMAQHYLLKYEKVLRGERLNTEAPQLAVPATEKFLPFA
jgi:glycosyltransferase involved in cell wall biosynthesis